jgi:hypothetical protein
MPRDEKNPFNGGYLGIVSSDPDIIWKIIKQLAEQKGGYSKDMEFPVNKLGGVYGEVLDEHNIKYEKGGRIVIRTINRELAVWPFIPYFKSLGFSDIKAKRKDDGSVEISGVPSMAEGGDLADRLKKALDMKGKKKKRKEGEYDLPVIRQIFEEVPLEYEKGGDVGDSVYTVAVNYYDAEKFPQALLDAIKYTYTPKGSTGEMGAVGAGLSKSEAKKFAKEMQEEYPQFSWRTEWIPKFTSGGSVPLSEKRTNMVHVSDDEFVVYGTDEDGHYQLISVHDTQRGANMKLKKEQHRLDADEFESMGATNAREWKEWMQPLSYGCGGDMKYEEGGPVEEEEEMEWEVSEEEDERPVIRGYFDDEPFEYEDGGDLDLFGERKPYLYDVSFYDGEWPSKKLKVARFKLSREYPMERILAGAEKGLKEKFPELYEQYVSGGKRADIFEHRDPSGYATTWGHSAEKGIWEYDPPSDYEKGGILFEIAE